MIGTFVTPHLIISYHVLSLIHLLLSLYPFLIYSLRLCSYPVYVFQPSTRLPHDTPVVFALQGMAAPSDWNAFIIPTLLGIILLLISHSSFSACFFFPSMIVSYILQIWELQWCYLILLLEGCEVLDDITMAMLLWRYPSFYFILF